jgi:HD-GYP domain-containing protein (c-di-GMP phosphodiesterase class II)
VSGIRSLEVMGALSRATDLGTGLPDGHALRAAAIAARLAALAGLDEPDIEAVRQVGLLHSAGCTSDAHETALLYGEDLEIRADYARIDEGRQLEVMAFLLRRLGRSSSPAKRVFAIARGLPGAQSRARSAFAGHCEVAARLAERLSCSQQVGIALGYVFERWDGKGFPAGASGETIPVLARILHVGRDLALFAELAGVEGAVEVMRTRGGGAYEDGLSTLAVDHAAELLEDLGDGWDAAIGQPAASAPTLDDAELDAALETMADFADLKTPFTHGHSPAVSALAEAAAWRVGLAPEAVMELRRAALIHDLGRTGIGNDVWEQPGPLSAAQWEAVRMHPYLGERALARCPGLASLGHIAGGHSERLDRSGYYRGLGSGELGPEQRLLAAADVWTALGEPRAHRPAFDPAQAVELIGAEVSAGRLDAASVEAVITAAGERVPGGRGFARPADLTNREAEVLRLLALGMTNKQIADRLEISSKTVGHHLERAYSKADVHTRAAATLFALEQGIAGHQG